MSLGVHGEIFSFSFFFFFWCRCKPQPPTTAVGVTHYKLSPSVTSYCRREGGPSTVDFFPFPRTQTKCRSESLSLLLLLLLLLFHFDGHTRGVLYRLLRPHSGGCLHFGGAVLVIVGGRFALVTDRFIDRSRRSENFRSLAGEIDGRW